MTRLYDLMEHWSKVMEIGATPPVDIFPFLKWVPDWLLGNWRARAKEVQHEMNSLYGEVTDRVIQRRSKRGSTGSFMDKVLDRVDEGKVQLTHHQIQFLGGVAMEGGSDTSSAMILSFIKAMVVYPEVQNKAQGEIDSIIGEERTPNWDDYDNLPYVISVVKETMRWRPIGGLIPPHAATKGIRPPILLAHI